MSNEEKTRKAKVSSIVVVLTHRRCRRVLWPAYFAGDIFLFANETMCVPDTRLFDGQTNEVDKRTDGHA